MDSGTDKVECISIKKSRNGIEYRSYVWYSRRQGNKVKAQGIVRRPRISHGDEKA